MIKWEGCWALRSCLHFHFSSCSVDQSSQPKASQRLNVFGRSQLLCALKDSVKAEKSRSLLSDGRQTGAMQRPLAQTLVDAIRDFQGLFLPRPASHFPLLEHTSDQSAVEGVGKQQSLLLHVRLHHHHTANSYLIMFVQLLTQLGFAIKIAVRSI